MNRPKMRVVKTEDALKSQIDNERRLVGAAVLGAEEVRQWCGWLRPEQFHDQLLGQFWQRFVAGEDPTAITTDQGIYLDACRWSRELWYWDAPAFAKQIAQGAYLEQIGPLTGKLAQATATGDFVTAQECSQKIAALTPQTQRRAHTAVEVGLAFLETIETPHRNVMTWITPLDKGLAGLERQTLSVVAARTSMGKSTLAFQIARNVASNGEKALFFSLEMSETNLWARAACPLIGLTWKDVRLLELSHEQKERLGEECSKLMYHYGDRLLIHDKPCKTEDIWEIVATERPDLVVVDHLRLVGDVNENENRRLGAITWRLKQMAKALDCHAMVVAQLNRQPDARGTEDKRPNLTDLRDSGEIEENADVVLMLFRPGYYNRELDHGKSKSEAEIWVRKARDGVRDAVIKMDYDLKAQWFEAKG